MLRRFTAVLILHFLLCVGLSAAGLNPPGSAPQAPEVVQEDSVASAHGASLAFSSDADDHALMDDKSDLPDQLEPQRQALAGGGIASDMVAASVAPVLSAALDPPHKPPRLAGFFA